MPPILRDEFFIPAPLREQLVAIGIPRAKHTFEGLAGFFPRDFNVRALSMSAEDLGRVLVHLVGQKIVPLRDMAGPICIKQVRPGWHACRFYRDYNQLLDLIAPYIAEGLKNGEGCLWVVPEAVTMKAVCEALGDHVPDVEAYLASGQLEILSHPNWYLDAAGQLKTFEQVAQALLEKQERALAKGYKFLRAAGDTGWISGTEQSKAFIDYEMKVNEVIGATQVAAVCTYRADVTADELIAIVTAHEDARDKVAV